MAQKRDLKKEFKHLYSPSSKKVELVEVPPLDFVMVEGQIEAGQPVDQSPAYQQALEALYGISYGLKFLSKKHPRNPVDFTVMPLEGLWWTASSHLGFDFDREESWFFTALICQPDHITGELFEQVREELLAKKGADNPLIEGIRFERWTEGLSMQTMHIGPYSEERATIERMDAFAQDQGLVLHGKHHEIYLGDPRRAKPENLRTILRHPVQGAQE